MLVGALEHEFYDCPYTGNAIIPTEELIFFRGVAQPPTRCHKPAMTGNGFWVRIYIYILYFFIIMVKLPTFQGD